MKKIIIYILNAIKNPKMLISTYKFYFDPETLSSVNIKNINYSIFHIAAFTPNNSGDALQTVLVRDIFKIHQLGVSWSLRHVHQLVSAKDVYKFNKSDAIVIGSGGLILPIFEDNSGWQWNCNIAEMKKITSPFIGFALGYNLFNGHDVRNEIFRKNINQVISKSIFWGMRNTGSVDMIKKIVNKKIKDKVTFQPCLTTLLSKLYPEFFKNKTKRNVVALNCAFDRPFRRYGENREKILNQIACAMKLLSQQYEIHYFANSSSDNKMLSYLDRNKVPYIAKKVYDIPIQKIIYYYSYPKIVLGMRGHSQLIPFGCGTKIISLITHQKLQWFLDDISASNWGISVTDNYKLDKQIPNKVNSMVNDNIIYDKIEVEKEKLLDITKKNMDKIIMSLNKS